jgi:hypothetical protein
MVVMLNNLGMSFCAIVHGPLFVCVEGPCTMAQKLTIKLLIYKRNATNTAY